MNNRIKYILFFICFFSIILSGCSDNVTNPGGQILLSGTWRLTMITDSLGNTLITPSEPWEYNIQFSDDDSVFVQNACNFGDGEVLIYKKNRIDISVSCIEAGCSDPTPYLGYCDDLNQSTWYELDNGTLKICSTKYNGDQRILYHKKMTNYLL